MTASTDDVQLKETLSGDDDVDDETNFFRHMDVVDIAEEDDVDTDEAAQTSQHQDAQIKHRKPLWWRQRAGQRGSKAQRRAYQSMASKKVPALAYGEMCDFAEIFGSPTSHPQQQQLWIEIGSGQGDVLLANAERNPHVAMIGADVYKPGIGSTLVRIEGALRTNEYWKGYDKYETSKDPYQESELEGSLPEPLSDPSSMTQEQEVYSNVRVFPGDGMKLLKNSTPTSSMDRILMTFPDPFPKEGQKVHRVLQTHTIQDLHRVLKPRGRFFLATDHPDFHVWSLDLFNASTHQFRKVEPCPHRSSWLPVISKYEQKGWDEGRQTFLACWEAIK